LTPRQVVGKKSTEEKPASKKERPSKHGGVGTGQKKKNSRGPGKGEVVTIKKGVSLGKAKGKGRAKEEPTLVQKGKNLRDKQEGRKGGREGEGKRQVSPESQ